MDFHHVAKSRLQFWAHLSFLFNSLQGDSFALLLIHKKTYHTGLSYSESTTQWETTKQAITYTHPQKFLYRFGYIFHIVA